MYDDSSTTWTSNPGLSILIASRTMSAISPSQTSSAPQTSSPSMSRVRDVDRPHGLDPGLNSRPGRVQNLAVVLHGERKIPGRNATADGVLGALLPDRGDRVRVLDQSDE